MAKISKKFSVNNLGDSLNQFRIKNNINGFLIFIILLSLFQILIVVSVLFSVFVVSIIYTNNSSDMKEEFFISLVIIYYFILLVSFINLIFMVIFALFYRPKGKALLLFSISFLVSLSPWLYIMWPYFLELVKNLEFKMYLNSLILKFFI